MAELTIPEPQAGMQTGELTARSLTEMYLARIAAIDQAGPTLNSVIELNPDALGSPTRWTPSAANAARAARCTASRS